MTEISAALAARRAGLPLLIGMALQSGDARFAFTSGVPDRKHKWNSAPSLLRHP